MSNVSNVESAHSLGEANERLREKWAAITAFGVLLVVLGVAALFFSLIATIVTVTLNGVLFLVAGAAEIGIGMHSRTWGRFFLWVVGGLLYLAVGVLCIVDPVLASVALTLVLGAALIAAGVVRAFLAAQLPPDHPRALIFLAAAVTILLGHDHFQSLAGRQRLCHRHSARRRPPVSRGWMGELRHGAAPGLSRILPLGIGGSTMTKWVYSFSAERAEGRAEMKNLLGGKGANLHEMASLGLPVPPGFTITTEVCTYFYANGKTYPADLAAQVDAAVAEVGRLTGRAFGDAANPLLVSVRSGARASMPGMMDTVLNLGLNDTSVEALARTSNDARFAYDSYRRFIQMYSNVVLEVDVHNFEDILEQYKEAKGYSLDTDLSAEDWRAVIADYKARVVEETGKPFPQDPRDQLWGAVGAVFSSWMNQRAVTYRRLNHIPAEWGTAVNVQAMVFGNMGETSATGVAFTRNPSTGEKALYGEFLVNAQGEDVVAGIRTPQNITEAARKGAHSDRPSLEALMPGVFKQFADTTELLEKHYKDMQDLEFTVERGKLWMLQTRNGKRTAKAALKVAVEMANEGLISREDAVSANRTGRARSAPAPDARPEN